MTVKIGAAAWITAVRPESMCVSAKPSSQNGTALLSAPSTRIGQRWPRTAPGRRAAAGPRAARDVSAPKTSRPSDHDRRLERLDAELDEEERRSPDRGEEQQEGGIAAGHGFVTVIAAGSACEVAPAARRSIERALAGSRWPIGRPHG